MTKTRLPAILLNSDFYSKPRNIIWIQENGAEGVVVLQQTWLLISQEKNCKIKKKEVINFPFCLKISKKKIEKILNSAVEVGLLELEDDHYFNSQITEKYNEFEKKREIYRQNASKRNVVNCKAIAEQLQNKSNLPLSLPLDNNINKNSAPDLPPVIDGRKQCKNGKYVYLSEIEKELLISNYASEGIEKTVISEAIFILSEHIEKNINAPNAEEYLRKGQQKAFEMLSKSWVKDEARKKQKNKIDLETSQKRADYRRAVNATEGRVRQNNSPPKGSQVADLIKNLSAQKAVA